MANDQGTLVI